MNNKDFELLEIYVEGFNDELSGDLKIKSGSEIQLRAYRMGRGDAIIGDEISSSDEQTGEEILERIKFAFR